MACGAVAVAVEASVVLGAAASVVETSRLSFQPLLQSFHRVFEVLNAEL